MVAFVVVDVVVQFLLDLARGGSRGDDEESVCVGLQKIRVDPVGLADARVNEEKSGSAGDGFRPRSRWRASSPWDRKPPD